MLIDAAHAEETRVVVVDGTHVEEFDFESRAKKQLRGNIYLAKVTRVEPSLQAAFVEYGGNRHGFLAFNEIHPDYYQIPLADREALMREEAEDDDDDHHHHHHAGGENGEGDDHAGDDEDDVMEEELARRRKDWTPPVLAVPGGYQQLFVDHVAQADTGADFDFLVGCRGHAIARESH